MDHDDAPHSSARDTYLVVLLCIFVGLPLFVFFNIVTMGLFVLLLVMALLIGGLAAVNYFLWGRSFTRETAWEREEAELTSETDGIDWSHDDQTYE
jgi:hypothetical protein